MSEEPALGGKAQDKHSMLPFIRHELRTPINAIIGYSEMLLEEVEQIGAQQLHIDLENIHTAGHELLTIVNDGKLESDLENFGTNFRPAMRTIINNVVGYTEMLLEDAKDNYGEAFSDDLLKIQTAGKQLFRLIEDFAKLGNTKSVSQQTEAAREAPVTADADSDAAQQTGAILVADDNEMNRDLLSRHLTKLGYTVTLAENGRIALDLMGDNSFDLVLLDMMMPELNGFETLKTLKNDENYRDIPVIMLSALDESDNVVRCIEMGAEDYLPKPPNKVLLHARIGACLEKKRLRDLEIEFQKQLKKINGALEVRNTFIRETFGRYLSDEIVENILESPAGLKLGGEKRDVTVMMSDLRGFTTIGERLPPEDVVGMINIHLEKMTEVILKYHGTIDEFIGDAILVIFGAPIQRQDDAVCAVACALEMQLAMDEVNRLNREVGYPELGMGIGINTGSVVVGNIGSSKRVKYGVVGKNVNLTSRIESYTKGGQILVSESTVNACGGTLRIDGTMEVTPKGISHPITIYEIGGIAGDFNVCLPEKTGE